MQRVYTEFSKKKTKKKKRENENENEDSNKEGRRIERISSFLYSIAHICAGNISRSSNRNISRDCIVYCILDVIVVSS